MLDETGLKIRQASYLTSLNFLSSLYKMRNIVIATSEFGGDSNELIYAMHRTAPGTQQVMSAITRSFLTCKRY